MDINKLAQHLMINSNDFENYFNKFGKIKIKNFKHRGKLIVVTSINPTVSGEGKTSLLIGLVDALNSQGHLTIGALRQPSMGPNLGMKGGATGGGDSYLQHQDLINLNFTGDFHAISTANNLITTIIENEIYYNSKLNIDVNKILWNRCIDLDDRGLRALDIRINDNKHYQTKFNITAASDMMALFCLCEDAKDFKQRIGDTIIAYSTDNQPVCIKHLEIVDSIMAILQQALLPNLVATKYNNPVIVHGGPFANIAHGCNSLMATKTALSLGEYVITECGFGSDLGFEKFMNIKMQSSGLYPNLVIVCVTLNTLKHHGQIKSSNVDKIEFGFKNLLAHVKHINQYGLQPLIILNQYENDTDQEIKVFENLCKINSLTYQLSNIYAAGLKNAKAIADAITKNIKDYQPKFLYNVQKDDLLNKIDSVCKNAYHATKIEMEPSLRKQIADLKCQDYFVCIAKTQYSLSSNSELLNWPNEVIVKIQSVEINHAARLVIPMCEKIWKMPGLPINPRAKNYK